MNKPWARMRIHGPCMIFDWHCTKEEAEEAISKQAASNGEQVLKFMTVAYFPSKDKQNA